VEPLTRGANAPDPRSVCPLSSTEFVEPPLEKIPGTPLGIEKYRAPTLGTKFRFSDRLVSGLVTVMTELPGSPYHLWIIMFVLNKKQDVKLRIGLV
jgi:hypothetical protein